VFIEWIDLVTILQIQECGIMDHTPTVGATTVIIQNRRSPGAFAGVLGCLFAVLGIFTIGPIFIPIGILCGLVGIVMGITGKSLGGVSLSMLSLAFSGLACLLSPTMWIALGVLFAAGALGAHTAKANVPQPIPTLQTVASSATATPAPLTSTPVADATPLAPFVGEIGTVVPKMTAFINEAGNNAGRCSAITQQYIGTTASARDYAQKRGLFPDAPSADLGRAELVAAINEEAMQNQKVRLFQSTLNSEITPVVAQAVALESQCQNWQSGGSPMPGAAEACASLWAAEGPFQQAYDALSDCLPKLEALYDDQRRQQQTVLSGIG
jgi:hypothetical protein